MKSNPDNPKASDGGEETLRLIAALPAPQGLEERVHEALRATPRPGRVLAWPARFRSRIALENHWMRTAAAAAIVFVIAGGGWGVYTRVEHGQNGKVVVMPAPVPVPGGFSPAGAIRTPTTLPGPTVREQGNKGTRGQDAQPGAKARETKTHPNANSTASRAASQPGVSK